MATKRVGEKLEDKLAEICFSRSNEPSFETTTTERLFTPLGMASVEARSDLIIDGRMANEGDGWSGSGANPWHLDKQSESILFLTNESDKPARIGFQVTVGDVHYYLSNLKLDPHETRAIDIRKLRDAQQTDLKGNKI